MLHYTPITSGKIINACAALHNICLDADVPLSIDEIFQPPPPYSGDHEVHFPAARALVTVGNHNRDEVIAYIMQHLN